MTSKPAPAESGGSKNRFITAYNDSFCLGTDGAVADWLVKHGVIIREALILAARAEPQPASNAGELDEALKWTTGELNALKEDVKLFGSAHQPIEVLIFNKRIAYFETVCKALRASKGDGQLDSDREVLAAWMIKNGFATGHGDTIHDLLGELDWQIKELRASKESGQGQAECVTCKDDPLICANVPGLRHCEKAVRPVTTEESNVLRKAILASSEIVDEGST